MKKIYIVLTHTGTALSRVIKTYTKDEFSHVSIALDEELNQMYSFGRLHPYNPFWAGFVHEYIDQGTFKRFYKTKAKVYSLDVTDEQYEKVKYYIHKIEKDKEEYTFNIIGLFAVGFHRRVEKEHSFYCAEFVKYVIENAGIEVSLPEIVRPENFKEIHYLKETYDGLLRKYQKKESNVMENLKKSFPIYFRKEKMV